MNINLAQVCGRITRDLEIRAIQTGTNVLQFGVASNRTWKDKEGRKQEEVEFHNCVAFGRTAEIIAQYFQKGDEIYVIGRLKTSTWEPKEGGKRYKTDIIVEKFEFGQKSSGKKNIKEPVPEQEQEEIDIKDIPF